MWYMFKDMCVSSKSDIEPEYKFFWSPMDLRKMNVENKS